VNFEIELMKDLGVKVSTSYNIYLYIAEEERGRLRAGD
jgi:hypothetical protein